MLGMRCSQQQVRLPANLLNLRRQPNGPVIIVIIVIITCVVFIADTAQHARPPATLLDDILWCVTDDLAAVRIDPGNGTAPPAGYT
jgi:hypothetical protein